MAIRRIEHKTMPVSYSLWGQLVASGAVGTREEAVAAILGGDVYLRVDYPNRYWVCLDNPDSTLLLTRPTVLRLSREDFVIYLTLIPRITSINFYPMSEDEQQRFYGEDMKKLERTLHEAIDGK